MPNCQLSQFLRNTITKRYCPILGTNKTNFKGIRLIVLTTIVRHYGMMNLLCEIHSTRAINRIPITYYWIDKVSTFSYFAFRLFAFSSGSRLNFFPGAPSKLSFWKHPFHAQKRYMTEMKRMWINKHLSLRCT